MICRRLAVILAAIAAGLVPVAAAQTADCGHVSTESFLDANGVRAKILNNGGLFWNGGENVYQVDGHDALFTATLVAGGLVDGELRTAASTYGPFEFWPGPADSMAAGVDCERFNRMYRVALRDVHAIAYGEAPTPDLAEWPWQFGAAVRDGDGNPNNYNLAGGDRPEMLGSEMVYWIMNDLGGPHERSDTSPLGIEVHGTAFAAPSRNPALNDATFYRYRIINRSDTAIDSMFVGFAVDPDLGAAFDDYVGSDSLTGLAFAYNSDNDDDGNFGLNPPAVGFRIFEGPVAQPDGYDNDFDGVVDEPGERLGMSYFTQYGGGAGAYGDMGTGSDFYNYLSGRWKNGERITEGGNGIGFSARPTRFMFSGDPPAYWSELDIDGEGTTVSAADRRFVQGMGPFRLDPGEETELFVGILYARGDDYLHSVELLQEYAAQLDGLRPEDVVSDFGIRRIHAAPEQREPVDGAVNLLSSVRFDWSSVENGLVYQLEIDALSGSHDRRVIDSRSATIELDLNPYTDYRWRVRSVNSTDAGPWSAYRRFNTGERVYRHFISFQDAVVVRNAAGPLAQAVGMTADWQGFPGTGPPTDEQQSGPARWLLHTLVPESVSDVGYEYFLRRSFRSWGQEDVWGTAYEIRFEGSSVAEDYGSGRFIELPLEVWSIGKGTPDDTSDDYRMIPWVYDMDGDGYGLSTEDHLVSDEMDDPYTDPIYILEPIDTSPGEAGYLHWEQVVNEGVPTRDDVGPERLARLVFVNWDAGTPRSDDIEQEVPEPGTIIRILTRPHPAPTLNAPVSDAVLTTENAVFQWTVYPEEPVTFETARDRDFNDVVVRVPVSGETLATSSLPNLSPGRYYWRVIAARAGISTTGSYLVGTTVDAEQAGGGTEAVILDVYPVPASDNVTIRVRIPAPTRADLSVFDVLGRRVLKDNVDIPVGESSLTLPVHRLAPGAYFLRLDAGGVSLNQRFIVSAH